MENELKLAREEKLKTLVDSNEILYSLFTNNKFDPLFWKLNQQTRQELKAIKLDYTLIFLEANKDNLYTFANRVIDILKSSYLTPKLVIQILLEYGKLQPEELLNEIYIVDYLLKSIDHYKDKTVKGLILDTLEDISKDEDIMLPVDKAIPDINDKRINELMDTCIRPIIPVKDFYNYIIVPCDKYCTNLLNNFIKIFNCSDVIDEWEYTQFNQFETYEILRRLFVSRCIFSHNDNETNYHPMLYRTRLCRADYCFHDCNYAHGKDSLVQLYRASKCQDLLYSLQVIQDSNYSDDLLLISSSSSDVALPKDLFKTIPCRFGKLCKDKKGCFYYHYELEKRRNPKIYKIIHNQPCPRVYVDGKWGDVKLCPNKEGCGYFHTKNELFYDRRNLKRIYNCVNEAMCSGVYCPYKHSDDIAIEELSLPTCEKVKLLRMKGIIENLDREIVDLKEIIENNDL
jgi:hypothetical protein